MRHLEPTAIPKLIERRYQHDPEERAAMLGRNNKYEAVLEKYGLEKSSMAVIGADRAPDSKEWHVMVSGSLGPKMLDLRVADRLEADLRRIDETALANRLSAAIATAKRKMRPGE